MKISKLLIANRGEIALRIMRTARIMGYTVVAVYSEQDKHAAHVLEADERVYLPGETLAETYLNIQAIIKAAKETNADAIHPGYGFLSENPLFAEACEKEGILFVGPSSSSIKAMGNKIAAREIAKKHGVPVTPGITGTPEELLKNYHEVGFPALVKAAAGGGGKGMRIVRSENEIANALQSTASEAANYFGDSTIYIERFFENPRHIEVQVLGDKHGNMIHLFERECSVQRRHQKIIEEAPSPTLTPEVREKMCAAAITLASSIGYYNAGTIEFLVDHDLNFYFLEMNTRIQVEHPVTEMITGVDIVKEQFLVAEGEKLSYNQKDLSINGHAIEVRVYAEDPQNNFMPSPGTILKYSFPENKSVRIDDAHLKDGAQIFSNFDPMISKVIAHADNRTGAIEKLVDFLPHYTILGIKTNLSFLGVLLEHSDYIGNNVHTRYLDNHIKELNQHFIGSKNALDEEVPLKAATLYSMLNSNGASSKKYNNSPSVDKTNHALWNEIGYWRLSGKISAELDKQEYILDQHSLKQDSQMSNNGACFTIKLNDKEHDLYMVKAPDDSIHIRYAGHEFHFSRPDVAPSDETSFTAVKSHKADSGDIVSPMPGRVLSVKVAIGDKVKKGDLLMVIEAMKMENNIMAPYDGLVEKVDVKQGDNVDNSSHLIHLAKEENVKDNI